MRPFPELTRCRALAVLVVVVVSVSGCARSTCNAQGQPADPNPRSAAGVLDSTCPSYDVVGGRAPPCTDPADKRCVYRAMGDCATALPGAACDVCADVVCGCSCPAAGLDGGSADAGCSWTCGR